VERRWTIQQRQKQSREYAPRRGEYIPRKERAEWAAVGLLGRVRAWKGQPLNPAWPVLRDHGRTVEVLVK